MADKIIFAVGFITFLLLTGGLAFTMHELQAIAKAGGQKATKR